MPSSRAGPSIRRLARAGIDKAYDWLADAKLDPGGPKVGDAPYKADDDAHKAAWYVHQAGGDPKRAIDDLDTQRFNMEAMQKRGRGPNGVIAPNFYAGAIARVDRMKKIIDEHGDALPKYAEPDRGHMYEAEIQAHPEHLLHWDKPLSQQSDYVRQRLSDLGYALPQHDAGKFEWRPGGHPDGQRALSQRRSAAAARPHRLLAERAPRLWSEWSVSRRGDDADAAREMAEDRFAVRPAPPKEMTGEEIYRDLGRRAAQQVQENYGGFSAPARASEMLRDAGIPALRYFDANSRRQGLLLPDVIRDAEKGVAKHADLLRELEAKRGDLTEGSTEWARNEINILNTQNNLADANRRLAQSRKEHADVKHNFVIFDPSTVNIIRRYGLAGVLGGGAAAAAGGPQSE
jgi:hypothetical protein